VAVKAAIDVDENAGFIPLSKAIHQLPCPEASPGFDTLRFVVRVGSRQLVASAVLRAGQAAWHDPVVPCLLCSFMQ